MRQGTNLEFNIKVETIIFNEKDGPESQFTAVIGSGPSWLRINAGWGRTDIGWTSRYFEGTRYYTNRKDYCSFKLGCREWIWKRDYVWRTGEMKPWALELPEDREEWPHPRGKVVNLFDRILFKVLGPWMDDSVTAAEEAIKEGKA